MAEAAEAVATEEYSLQPDQLRPPVSVPVSSSSIQLKPPSAVPSPDTVLMNVSGTRYSVGELQLLLKSFRKFLTSNC